MPEAEHKSELYSIPILVYSILHWIFQVFQLEKHFESKPMYLALYDLIVPGSGNRAQTVGAKQCPASSSESVYSGVLYHENHLILCLNDYCKRKETPENGYLDSSRLV